MANWHNKKDDEIIQRLKNVLRTEDFQFIGKFEEVTNKEFGFFKEVRSLSGVKKFYPKDDGSTDNEKLRPLEIYTKAYTHLVNGQWYKFYAVPAAKGLRVEKRNPFLLQTDWTRVKNIVPLKGEELIDNIKNDALATPEGIAGNLMRAIETISVDINTEPTTFIFELIQNADDYPNKENNVSITFQIKDSFLIIKHNGSPFEVNNTVALCGINEGDKRGDKTKIGFKGIGFKSIFKDSNYAYIKSGDFSFRFDEEFWKKEGIEIFWHITPINTTVDQFDEILDEESNVNIVIKPKEFEILKNYQNTFITNFSDERVLLFLRNVKSLIFDSQDEKFEIANISSKWKIYTENNIIVPEQETIELNRKINFPDKRIPSKFYDLNLTEVGFAFKINENLVESISDGTIYAYLPTKVNLGFSFIINANFIPDASRTKIYDDITWNWFLFEQAGGLFLKHIVELISDSFNIDSVLEVIPVFSEIAPTILDDDKRKFVSFFKKGFDNDLLTIKFIPNGLKQLEALPNIVIDETGLSELIPDEFFKLTELKGAFISNEIKKGKEKITKLLKEYDLHKNIYTLETLSSDLKKESFQDWLKIPENNFKIIQHFSKNEEFKELLASEAILLTENNVLKKLSEVYDIVPPLINFVFVEKVNSELSSLLSLNNISLKLKTYEPIAFYKKHIQGEQDIINKDLNDELKLLNFWNYIYDNWSLFESVDIIKASIKYFNILTQSFVENTVPRNIITKVYIAAIFNPENKIESVINEIGIPDAQFISEKYLSEKRTAVKWYKIFKQAHAISDLQKVINVLLPILHTLEESKHFAIAKQIFKYWKDNQNKESQLTENQLNLIRKNLKIKCIDDKYYDLNHAIISDHYQNNNLIQSILPRIELTNQISNDYGPRATQLADWKILFHLFKCKELPERQHVLDQKITYFVENQTDFKESHFDVLKSISEIFSTKNESGLNFPDSTSNIKLLSDKDQWLLPKEIYLSSVYNPKIDLQNDREIDANIKFLNRKYTPNEIGKYFITSLGVNNGFNIKKLDLKRDQLPLEYLEVFEKKFSYIASNAIYYGSQHKLTNHIEINYPHLLVNLKYSLLFWEEVVSNSKYLNYLFEISNYQMAFNKVVYSENYLTYFIKNNLTIPNVNDELKKPEDLYSFSLQKYIDNRAELPKFDFSYIYQNNNENPISLEDFLGIKKLLSKEYCIKMLSKSVDRISIEEIIDLKIIEILKDYTPSEIEKTNFFLMNQNLEWKSINELLFTKEEGIDIDDNQKLHDHFITIAENFGIQELSDANLVLKTIPKIAEPSTDISLFFKNKAKFIAFKIDHIKHTVIEEQIINKIEQYNFHEVTSIVKVFPENRPIYASDEFKLYIEENSDLIIYKNYWKSNVEIVDFIFKLVSQDRITKTWFENLVARWDDKKIIENLMEEFGEIPEDWNNDITEENEVETNGFLTEVENYIESMREIEDIYDAEKIEDLKSILAEFKNHPKEKQLTFNLLAKLKLCKKLSIEYDKAWEYNSIETEEIKYLIHSARGSFAYIHPNEILKMRDDGFKMAIDYGTKDIRIYNTHSEIISLYQNYLMLYQNSPSEEDILNICENSKSKDKFHFLIADREKQVGEGLAIFKFLNNETYD